MNSNVKSFQPMLKTLLNIIILVFHVDIIARKPSINSILITQGNALDVVSTSSAGKKNYDEAFT